MTGLSKRFEWCYQYLASKKFTLILFFVLSVILIPRTFSETEDITLGWIGTAAFALFSLNLILCTVQRISRLPASVIVIHSGIIVTFAGAVISSFGYVATVNIYEGDSVSTVYRWDKEKDMPLGVDLRVKKIHLEYYPQPVRVGVLRGTEKVGLYEVMTGEHFSMLGLNVSVDFLDLTDRSLTLSVHEGEAFLGTVTTGGTGSLPDDFPYEFKLIAFKNSALKQMWVDLELHDGMEILARGISSVNDPLTWENINYYHVKVDYDANGNPYAGIQITSDPGVPYVYAGFIIVAAGSLMYMKRRLYG